MTTPTAVATAPSGETVATTETNGIATEIVTVTTETVTTVTERTTAPTTTSRPTTAVPLTGSDAWLCEAVRESSEKYGADAVQVAVVKDGALCGTAQYGWAEKGKRPLEEGTQIRIASLSKTAVAMVAFRLIDEGKLGLDADISDYLGVTVRNPAYPEDPITVRMLLTHTSGLKNAGYVIGLDKLRKQLTSPSVFTDNRPGTAVAYNNYAYGVLGSLCEVVGGKSLTSMAREYFFEPMNITAAFTADALRSEEVAVLYRADGRVGLDVKGQRALRSFTEEVAASMRTCAGGLTISAADYAKLLALFMRDGVYDGKQLLSTDSVRAMLSEQNEGKGVWYCMPLWKRDGLYGQTTLYYHTGSAYGVYSLYAFDSEIGTGVVVCTTGATNKKDSYGVYAVCGDIARAVFSHY